MYISKSQETLFKLQAGRVVNVTRPLALQTGLRGCCGPAAIFFGPKTCGPPSPLGEQEASQQPARVKSRIPWKNHTATAVTLLRGCRRPVVVLLRPPAKTYKALFSPLRHRRESPSFGPQLYSRLCVDVSKWVDDRSQLVQSPMEVLMALSSWWNGCLMIKVLDHCVGFLFSSGNRCCYSSQTCYGSCLQLILNICSIERIKSRIGRLKGSCVYMYLSSVQKTMKTD